MRQITSLTMNFLRTAEGHPQGEVILFHHDGQSTDGTLRNSGDFRFFGAASELRQLAKSIAVAADRLDEMPVLLTKDRDLNVAAVEIDRDSEAASGEAIVSVSTSLAGIEGLTEEDLERRLVLTLAKPR